MLIAVNLEPILINNEYMDVLTLDRMPDGPIKQIVRQIHTQELSIFNQGLNKNPCKYVLLSDASSCYLTKEDIPFLFSYLMDNGYTINAQMTKLYKGYSNKLVCLFE